MPTNCTVCREPMPGHPDDDVCCVRRTHANFAGDLLALPPPGATTLVARGAGR